MAIEEMQFQKVVKNKVEIAPFQKGLIIMEDNNISFPTLGEIVRELFNCSGLLPNKGERSELLLSGNEKKLLQMQLKRLADESSRIEGKLEVLLATFYKLLIKVVPNKLFASMIMEFVKEALTTYRAVLIDDGTYLSKHKTTKWLIKTYLIDRLVISFHKNYLRFNIASEKLDVPYILTWCLPDFSNEKTTWPLSHAWKLIYDSLSISQLAFHYPDKHKEDPKAIQNLEKAQRWVAGKQLPSISSLFSNLEYSITLLNETENPKLHRNISSEQLIKFKLILFVARIATYFFKEIQCAYGSKFLRNICLHLKRQSSRLNRVNKMLELEINAINSRCSDLTKEELDHITFLHVDNYWQSYAVKQQEGAQRLQDYLEANAFDNLSSREKAMVYISCVGSFQTYSLLEMESFNVRDEMRDEFPRLLAKGMRLKKKINSISEAELFEQELEELDFKSCLGWLSSWCYANYYYQHEDNEKAYLHYKEAFNRAKYAAGRNQYLLINQYIESCAKNNKYRDMKKAVAWAYYLGIEVRWLRGWDDPEAEATLRSLFNFMGQNSLRYAQL